MILSVDLKQKRPHVSQELIFGSTRAYDGSTLAVQGKGEMSTYAYSCVRTYL